MPSQKVIAVTGATGFVGQHLIPTLLEGGYDVRALVRTPSKLPAQWQHHPRFEIVQGDLSSDLTTLVQGANTVIHMAGLIKARTRHDFFAANEGGTLNIAKAAKAASVKKFILLSSMAARKPQLSHYAASKHAGEDAAVKYFGDDTTIIRAPAVFGPGDEATKPIFDMIAKGRLPVAGGNWKNINLSMVYVTDLVNFIRDQITATSSQRPVEPATIGKMSWQEFAKLCSDSLQRPVKIMAIPSFILWPVAALTSATSRLFGVGHLTLAKLREFQHVDWTSEDIVDNPTPMIIALRETANAYRN